MMRTILACSSVLLLAACAEPDQAQSGRNANDIHPSQGAKNTFVAEGWAPGDKAAWQTHLRTRAQHQNEYVKVN